MSHFETFKYEIVITIRIPLSWNRQSVWYPDLPEDGLSDSTLLEDFLKSPKSNNNSSSNIPNDDDDGHAATARAADVPTNVETDSDDDKTLVDDLETDGGRCDSVVTQTEDALHFTEDEDLVSIL